MPRQTFAEVPSARTTNVAVVFAATKPFAAAPAKADVGDRPDDAQHGLWLPVYWRRVVRLLNFVAKSTSKVSSTVVGGLIDQCLTATFTLSAAMLFLLASSIT
jgi:hypothetical protein